MYQADSHYKNEIWSFEDPTVSIQHVFLKPELYPQPPWRILLQKNELQCEKATHNPLFQRSTVPSGFSLWKWNLILVRPLHINSARIFYAKSIVFASLTDFVTQKRITVQKRRS